MTYTNNAMLATLKDAENNLTTYEYDGFDRLAKTRFPLPAKGSNASSATDYEQLLSYDANSNVGSRRLRDGASIAFTYDKLDRVTLKNLPGTEPDVSYAWDNLGRITSASQTGNALYFTWDALSRNLTQAGPQGTASYQYDAADRRTQLTYPGTGLYVNTDYLVTGEVTKLRENGATTGVGVLATYAYDNLGNRLSTTFGNGAAQAFTYDPVSRLGSLTNDLSGTSNDLTATFAYNPASQIASTTRSGDAYAWTGHFNENKAGTANGLNQITTYGAKSLSHDTKGNVTAFGTETFGYSSENLLTSGPNSTTFNYDPLIRLYQTVSGSTSSRFAYDGLDMIAEYNGSNALQRRWVFDPQTNAGQSGQPILWYEGSGTTNRRFLSSDERRSVISLTDSAGALIGINRYDEYGVPQSTNLGLFGYTGQAWLPEVTLFYYKARVYEPEIGRFWQTDPIGYVDSPNLYAYVVGDPINFNDPLGLKTFLAVRPIQLGGGFFGFLGFGHMFLVDNAKWIGDPTATIISFGEVNGQLRFDPQTQAYDRLRWIANTDIRYFEIGLPNGILSYMTSKFPQGVYYNAATRNSNTAAYNILLAALSAYLGVNVTAVNLGPLGMLTTGATWGTVTISGQYSGSRITWSKNVTIFVDSEGNLCVKSPSGKIECSGKDKTKEK